MTNRLELGLNLSMGNWAESAQLNVKFAQEAERLGYSSVWTEEAYGNDAVVPLTWIAALTTNIDVGSAIMQLSARTPAATSMTAATLDRFSGGRFRLGLGVSGPQVVEGWHGRPFDRPLQRTREYVELVRRMVAREGAVESEGPIYPLPYPGGTGQGKPLKLILHPLRSRIPIYIGALGPRNVALTAEIADGWLPSFMSPSALSTTFRPWLWEGFSRADNDKEPGRGFDVAPTVAVVLDDDVDVARRMVKERLAFYIGGMGSEAHNFSNNLVRRLGYEATAADVQRRFLEGDRQGATSAVPDALVDDVALCGPRQRIAERLTDWLASDVTTMIVQTDDLESIRLMAELVL